MFSGLPKHCCARCATPHGVVGAAASPTATEREPLTGFGARSGMSSRYRYGSPDGLGQDAGTNLSPPCRNRRRHPQGRSPPPSQPLLPWPAPSVTAITHLPVPHRLQPPRLRHPHRADGLHGTGGGTGEFRYVIIFTPQGVILIHKTKHPYRYGVPYCVFNIILHKISIVQIFYLVFFFAFSANLKCDAINFKIRNT